MNKEIILVTPEQASYAIGLRQSIEGARFFRWALKRPNERLQLFDENKKMIFEGDLGTAKMLDGVANGLFNELVHPLNSNMERTTDNEMKELAQEVIEDARQTVF